MDETQKQALHNELGRALQHGALPQSHAQGARTESSYIFNNQFNRNYNSAHPNKYDSQVEVRSVQQQMQQLTQDPQYAIQRTQLSRQGSDNTDVYNFSTVNQQLSATSPLLQQHDQPSVESGTHGHSRNKSTGTGSTKLLGGVTKKKNSVKKQRQPQPESPDNLNTDCTEILSELIPSVRVPKFGAHQFFVYKSLTSRCNICDRRVFAYIKDMPVLSCSLCGFTTHSDCWRKAFQAENVVGTMNPNDIPQYVPPYEVCAFNDLCPIDSIDERLTKSSLLILKQRVLHETQAYAKSGAPGQSTQFAISTLGVFADMLDEVKARDLTISDIYQQFLKALTISLKAFVEDDSNVNISDGVSPCSNKYSADMNNQSLSYSIVNLRSSPPQTLQGTKASYVSDPDLTPLPWLDLFDVLDDILEDEEGYSSCEMSFSSLSVGDVTEELCWLDDIKFKAIELHELDGAVFTKQRKNEASPNVMAFIDQFNRVTYLVINDILMERVYTRRAKIIEYWVAVAQASFEIRSFNTAKAIVSGLQATSVFRLKKTWSLLSKDSKTKLDSLIVELSPDNNYQKYRERLNQIPAQFSCVPFLGVWLTDITYLSTALKDNKAELRKKTDKILKEVYAFQSRLLPLTSIFALRSYIMYTKCMDNEDDQYRRSLFLEPKGGVPDINSPTRHVYMVSPNEGDIRGSMKRSSSNTMTIKDARQSPLNTLRRSTSFEVSTGDNPDSDTDYPRLNVHGLVQSSSTGSPSLPRPPPRPPRHRQSPVVPLPQVLIDKKILIGGADSLSKKSQRSRHAVTSPVDQKAEGFLELEAAIRDRKRSIDSPSISKTNVDESPNKNSNTYIPIVPTNKLVNPNRSLRPASESKSPVIPPHPIQKRSLSQGNSGPNRIRHTSPPQFPSKRVAQTIKTSLEIQKKLLLQLQQQRSQNGPTAKCTGKNTQVDTKSDTNVYTDVRGCSYENGGTSEEDAMIIMCQEVVEQLRYALTILSKDERSPTS